MFGPNLRKHINEFRGYIRNLQYTLTPTGIWFPKARAEMGGIFSHWVTGYESEMAHDHNILTDEGLTHMMHEVLGNDTGNHVAAWYCMLHSGSGTPLVTTTAANYNSGFSEIRDSVTEGYTETTRPLWTPDAMVEADTEIINDAAPCTFTIVTASTLVVNGAALVATNTKTSDVGPLMSAVKFSATRNLVNTDEFNLKYKVDLDAS